MMGLVKEKTHKKNYYDHCTEPRPTLNTRQKGSTKKPRSGWTDYKTEDGARASPAERIDVRKEVRAKKKPARKGGQLKELGTFVKRRRPKGSKEEEAGVECSIEFSRPAFDPRKKGDGRGGVKIHKYSFPRRLILLFHEKIGTGSMRELDRARNRPSARDR